jgi:hypothetical protein
MNAAELDLTHLVALAAALGWASGMRLYAVVFLVGAAGWLGWVPLPPGLALLQHPLVLGVALLGAVSEFVADKIPGFDTVWDTLHTLIRIPAGAALAAGALGGDQAVWTLLAALMGGTLAATAHVAKASTRAAVNTSPEPLSNWSLSLAGDALVPFMLWLALTSPLWFFVLLAGCVVVAAVLIALLFKFVRALGRRVLPARAAAGA